MAPKAAHEAAKKKAAKQKKLLVFLAVALAGALGYAVMTMMKLSNPPQVPGTPAAATTPAGAIPTATPMVAVTPGIAALPVDSFRRFTVFVRRDPFNNGSKSTSTSSKPKKTKKPSGGGKSNSKQPAAPLTGAVIAFNGTKLALTVGSTFGHAPGLSGVALFRLVSVKPKSAVVGVVGTTQQFVLPVNRRVTLEQNGGWTYTLLLLPPGSAAPMKVATP